MTVFNLELDDLSLGELFALADEIGNKYQSQDEIDDYGSALLDAQDELSMTMEEVDAD